MYLIDTSVWIDYFRQVDNGPVHYFQRLLDDGSRFGITGIIYQELLQGAQTEADFNKLVRFVGSQVFYHPKDAITSYQKAAKIYFLCRRKGLTVRSSNDCLIAQLAIENELVLLHNDSDFARISQVVPGLEWVHC